MKAIYIVFNVGADEIPQVMECFSTKEKAEQYEKQLKHEWYNEYSIVEYELDPK